jgi:divinyl chlorophyllide a 8-vinyl-reductase
VRDRAANQGTLIMAVKTAFIVNALALASFVSPVTTVLAFAPSFSASLSSISSSSSSSLHASAFDGFNFKNPFTSSQPAASVRNNGDKVTVIAGATGYIGKSTVRESVRQGYRTVALVRDKKKVESDEGKLLYGTFFEGADVVECDVCDADKLTETLREISSRGKSGSIDTIISCLASRSGIKKDAYAIDYQATLNCLESGRAVNARHFVLLSAYCVKNPWLQFQQAKLKFEAALTSQQDMTYSIVRPTAFFKSVSGQLEVIQQGAPFVMFGDGEVTRCNPISEADLATYMIDCIKDRSRLNKIINLGGPDEPLTKKRQGEMLFNAVGKKPNFFYAPLWLFDTIIDSLQWVADTFKSEQFENAAELGRIGKYYAVEDMLTTDPSEKFGTMTLQEHYNKIAVEGQEYDPYTSILKLLTNAILKNNTFVFIPVDATV